MSKALKGTTGDQGRAVAYVRVSTEDQNLGPEAQRAAIEAWSRRAGVEVVATFEDRLSGATPVEDRPGLCAALEALRESGAGLLVAAKRDRIARDVVVAATVEALARKAGAKVATADGVSHEDTPEGALMRSILDAFSSYERALIRARTKAALQAKRSRGERVGSVPLGYRSEGSRIVADPERQAQISRALALRSEGLSRASVAHVLSQETGRRWHATQVARIEARGL